MQENCPGPANYMIKRPLSGSKRYSKASTMGSMERKSIFGGEYAFYQTGME